jgi:sulfite exporter TauE/SafE
MLASISPLGERARGHRWALTVSAYAAGSVAAATIAGALLGLLGAAALPAATRLPALSAAALAAGLADLLWPGHLPTLHRQVDEGWLDRYRSGVYGFGYGAQLGVGVATVVTTAAVYAWVVALVATGSAIGGAAVGLAFGVGRAVPLMAVAGVRTPADLRRVLRRLTDLAGVGRRGAAALCLVVGGAGLVALAAR